MSTLYETVETINILLLLHVSSGNLAHSCLDEGGTTLITIVLVLIVLLWFCLVFTYFPNLWTRILLKKELFVHNYAIFIQTTIHIYFILWDIIQCHQYCCPSSCFSTGRRRPFTLTPVRFLLVVVLFQAFLYFLTP